jgi:alpha-galactosidase
MAKPKITFIGAGSTVFAKNLMGDIFSMPELADARIFLYDIDPERLETSTIVGQRILAQLGVSGTVEATTDRERALEGADYVISMMQVAGYRPGTVTDFAVPKQFGLRQTIADTLGIGGIMRALRTIPVLLDYVRDMERLCPNALLLQYANPMVMNIWALSRASKIRTVGLCHSVQGTAQQLATDIGIPLNEINYVAAGINHMAFYLKFERNGEDLYPLIRKVVAEGRVPDWNRVRYDMFLRLGYFVTESSEHFSEYVPWYIKEGRDDLINRYNVPLDDYLGRSERQIERWHTLRHSLQDSSIPLEIRRSVEYGSTIIHSLETGAPAVVYGNVPNNGLIDNLPQGCVVEVPCLVDKNGLQPVKVGSLPPQLAAIMQTNINVQSLAVEAALTGKREHIYHAAMFDPHTAAELDLNQIWQMVDALIDAHGEWMPKVFRDAGHNTHAHTLKVA